MRRPVWIAFLLPIALLAAFPDPGVAARAEKQPTLVPAEEYPLYDLVVRSKYLMSGTTLVLIERLTVARAEKDEREYLSRDFFEAEGRTRPTGTG